jgi:GTP-binding protein
MSGKTRIRTIAIVGRPNVGKSRLFNRIIGRRTSIVHDSPGVTRDRVEAVVEQRGSLVRWIDTGGIGLEDEFGAMIALQAGVAIEAADAIIFVVDAQDGVVPLDQEIAARLRGAKSVIVAANKIDIPSHIPNAAEFTALGFPDVLPVSAEHGRGIEDLVDRALKSAGTSTGEEPELLTRVAIVGRPNVGKSSLLNAILGEERSIVSTTPGTTRDAIETTVRLREGVIGIVDTAGIRKKRTSMTLLETVMVSRARGALERSDVGIVLVDAVEGLTEQDVKIVGAALSLGRGVVLALNKWDAVGEKAFDAVAKKIRRKLGTESHVPIISISALKKLRVRKLLEVALQVGAHARHRIKTSDLNRILAVAGQRAPAGVRIKYGIQTSIMPPTFVIFGTEQPPRATASFLRNQIRATGGFEGVPIVMEFRR